MARVLLFGRLSDVAGWRSRELEAGSIAALTALNLWNFATLKEQLLLSERYDDLLGNILEVRRFEKNFPALAVGNSDA